MYYRSNSDSIIIISGLHCFPARNAKKVFIHKGLTDMSLTTNLCATCIKTAPACYRFATSKNVELVSKEKRLKIDRHVCIIVHKTLRENMWIFDQLFRENYCWIKLSGHLRLFWWRGGDSFFSTQEFVSEIWSK